MVTLLETSTAHPPSMKNFTNTSDQTWTQTRRILTCGAMSAPGQIVVA